MQVNINTPCTIVLTEAGAKVWNRAFDVIPFANRPVPKVAGDTVKTQLWCVMEIFGPHTYLGMREPLFQGNNLDILGGEVAS